eukprot:Nk52_evm10s287 gene=Nk52_evmTU10s287
MWLSSRCCHGVLWIVILSLVHAQYGNGQDGPEDYRLKRFGGGTLNEKPGIIVLPSKVLLYSDSNSTNIDVGISMQPVFGQTVSVFCVSNKPDVIRLTQYEKYFSHLTWNSTQVVKAHTTGMRGVALVTCYGSEDNGFGGTQGSVEFSVVYSYSRAVGDLPIILKLLLFPSGSIFLGTAMSKVLTFSSGLQCGGQHLSAGLIFGAIAIELLPYLTSSESQWPVVVGFIMGSVCMLSVWHFIQEDEEIEDRESDCHAADCGALARPLSNPTSTAGEGASLLGGNSSGGGVFPYSMVVATVIDCMIDGLLIGISYGAHAEAGALMAFAMTLEMFFVGVSVSMKLKKSRVGFMYYVLLMIIFPVVLILAGIAGELILSSLPPSSNVFNGILAFGIASLLYLTVEELLMEAHSEKGIDTPLISLWFFIGFLSVIVLEGAIDFL